MNGVIQGVGKSKMGRYFVTALLLALAVTGGLFAYAYTTTTAALDVTGGSGDYAQITANMTVPEYKVFGCYRGKIEAGTLFNVTPTTDYPGDVEVNVYLDNADELSRNYGLFLLRVTLVDSSDNPQDIEGIAKPLTLHNGVVSFVADNLSAGTTYYIKTTGGVYRAFPWTYINNQGVQTPSLTAEVLQAGW